MPYTVCRNNYASPNDSSSILYRNYGSLAECIAHAESVGYGHAQRCSCTETLTATEQALKAAQEAAMIAETQRLTEVVKNYYEGGEPRVTIPQTPVPRIDSTVSPVPRIDTPAVIPTPQIEKTEKTEKPSLPITLLTIIIVVVIFTMVLK